MKYTPNYGLKKPEQDDFYNVEDFNENADIIDEKLKEIEDGIENIEVPVTSVNEKTGDVVLTAEDVGAETPAGAQAKADATLNLAKQYTDQEVGEVAQELAELVSTVSADLEGKAPLTSPNFTGIPKVSGNMMYHTGNVTISTEAPTSALPEGHIHMTY